MANYPMAMDGGGEEKQRQKLLAKKQLEDAKARQPATQAPAQPTRASSAGFTTGVTAEGAPPEQDEMLRRRLLGQANLERRLSAEGFNKAYKAGDAVGQRAAFGRLGDAKSTVASFQQASAPKTAYEDAAAARARGDGAGFASGVAQVQQNRDRLREQGLQFVRGEASKQIEGVTGLPQTDDPRELIRRNMELERVRELTGKQEAGLNTGLGQITPGEMGRGFAAAGRSAGLREQGQSRARQIAERFAGREQTAAEIGSMSQEEAYRAARANMDAALVQNRIVELAGAQAGQGIAEAGKATVEANVGKEVASSPTAVQAGTSGQEATIAENKQRGAQAGAGTAAADAATQDINEQATRGQLGPNAKAAAEEARQLAEMQRQLGVNAEVIKKNNQSLAETIRESIGSSAGGSGTVLINPNSKADLALENLLAGFEQNVVRFAKESPAFAQSVAEVYQSAVPDTEGAFSGGRSAPEVAAGKGASGVLAATGVGIPLAYATNLLGIDEQIGRTLGLTPTSAEMAHRQKRADDLNWLRAAIQAAINRQPIPPRH